jgi:hypothetical protein
VQPGNSMLKKHQVECRQRKNIVQEKKQ